MGFNLKSFLGLSDFTRGAAGIKLLIASVLVEFLGTLCIVVFGCGSALKIGSFEQDAVRISLSFGLIVFAGVHFAGPVSGGHLNPAVTLGLLVAGRIRLLKALLYVVVQCVGAIAGAFLLYALTPEGHRGNLGANAINVDADATPMQGFGIEILTTFVLVLVILSVTDTFARSAWHDVPAAVGFTVVVCHLLALPFTGCSVNPARSLGPAIVAEQWDDHWVFWAGPILGALLAAVVYKLLLTPAEADRNREGEK